MFIRKLLNEIRNNIFVYVLLGLISLLFVYFVSCSTSPFYPYYYGDDSAQFQTIGRAWADGLIPYIDMFDHKGPLIFFIDMLGFCMTGSSMGIMLLQVVFLFVTLVAFYKMTQLATSSKCYGICAVILSLSVFHFVYSRGNFTEEYCLPFVSICTYFQIKYLTVSLEQKQLSHRPFHALLYGLSFGVCLLTRVTNGITICAGILIICCVLLKNKKCKNLLWNAFGFIIGFLLIFLPFAIYFAAHDLFHEFMYGTLLYNFEYQAYMSSWLKEATLLSILEFVVVHFTACVIFLVAVLAFLRRKTVLTVYCLLCGFLELYIFTCGASYSHYAIITLPQAIIFLNEIYGMETKKRIYLFVKRMLLGATVVFSIACTAILLTRVINLHNKYKEYHEVGYEQLLSMVPEEERDSFIAYGGGTFRELYLLHDITPCYKYFVMQEWHASFSEQTREDIHQVFAEGSAIWILTDGSTEVIQDILNSRYTIIAEMGQYQLFRLSLS